MRFCARGRSELGGRSSQQDDFDIQLYDNALGTILLFDGHGSDGGKIARAAKAEFRKLLNDNKDELCKLIDSSSENKLTPEMVKCTPSEPSDRLPQLAPFAFAPSPELELLINSLFAKVDESISENVAFDAYMSGTTAILALCTRKRVVVAAVGDGRVVLLRDPTGQIQSAEPFYLTIEHTCSNKTELERVLHAGASVHRLQLDDRCYGPPRIFKGTLPYPGLVVTRSIGDSVARKLGVIPKPSICAANLLPTDLFLLVGSDGLWDAMSNKKLTSLSANAFFNSPALLQSARKSKASIVNKDTNSFRKGSFLPPLSAEPNITENHLPRTFHTCNELSSYATNSLNSLNSSHSDQKRKDSSSKSSLEEADEQDQIAQIDSIVGILLSEALQGLDKKKIDDNVSVIFALL